MEASLAEPLREMIRAEMGDMFADLRRFVDRRLAEVSAEVHGAVQMVDFSEANITGQIGKIAEQVAQLIAAPASATRNSGLELEAVVQATEHAANQILEATEAISDWLASGARDSDSLEKVAERVNAIMEACTFQDLTGQRIRRAIEHLQSVESMLGGLANPDAPPPVYVPRQIEVTGSGSDLGQAAIDALLNDF
jgi:chemotaxis protein CheZ